MNTIKFNETIVTNGKKKIKLKLNNAEEMSLQHPDTFFIPPEPYRQFTPEGMLVKIFAQSKKMPERFWVRVTKRNNDKNGRVFYSGVVDDDLFSFDVKSGNEINYFEPKHIMDMSVELFEHEVKNGVIDIQSIDKENFKKLINSLNTLEH